jgi:2-octaprenylphenol hydroxylase
MVGAALACGLGQAGLQVALVEERPWQDLLADEAYHFRVSAVTLASESILRAYGAWEGMRQARMGHFREMRVWDAIGGGAIHFESADVGEPALGYIVENRVIQAGLEARLEALNSVTWFRPARLRGLSVEPGCVRATLDNVEIKALLLVGADGSDSQVRRRVGIPSAVQGYGQHALVTNVRTELSHQETAWQRFLPSGPLAFLPLPDNYSSIVWSTTPATAAALLRMPTQDFAAKLGRSFDSRLGGIVSIGPRATFPLRSVRVRRYVQQRVALVGDSAHTIHPLAGQGVNLGFLDAATLAEVIVEARAKGRDFGNVPALRRYERWRKSHNLTMQMAMDSLHFLFGSRFRAVQAARNLGLQLTDGIGPVKRLIMLYAMGRVGDLPGAARGAPWCDAAPS